MTAVVFDGQKLALTKRQQLQEGFRRLSRNRQELRLVDILVGNSRTGQLYTDLKKQASQEVGIKFEVIKVLQDAGARSLIDLVKTLNQDNKVAGIMLQLPLSGNLRRDQERIVDTIDSKKDVDCLTSYNLGRLLLGRPLILPATVKAIWQVLEQAGVGESNISGKKVVIVGRSNIVGKPMAFLLINKGATVTICHRRTKELIAYTSSADILISATGQPGLITGSMVKKGGVIVDVGSPKGDIDFDQAKNKASFITPVPGGVGPMTVACLLENFLEILS